MRRSKFGKDFRPSAAGTSGAVDNVKKAAMAAQAGQYVAPPRPPVEGPKPTKK
jgi:hypothetical protein